MKGRRKGHNQNGNGRPRGRIQSRPGTNLISNGVLEDGEYNSHLNERIGRAPRDIRLQNFGFESSETKILPRHRLLEKYEQESTAHISGWRGLPEIPTPEELLKSSDEIEVSGNVIDGPYDSVEEYLSTHYELLREDAVAHLREGVALLRDQPDLTDTSTHCIYESVRIIGFTWANIGVCAKVNFSLARAGKKIPWQSSKRLLPGSVVVLSCDSFNTIKVATIAARPLAGLQMTVPEVDLLFNEGEIDLDLHKVYVMIETRSSYYEAYRHTLRGLQRMQPSELPLARHLAELEPNIEPPAYVKEDPVYDLSPVFEDSIDKDNLKSVNILEEFPFDVQSSMDKTQKQALHKMLTSSLAIIQGPPGTGKTFTSVVALKAIIANMTEADPPIIVACQTNHALDQLLRHIVEFESNIVRLGGRTQDQDKIKARTLYEIRKSKNFQIQNQSIGRAKRQVEVLKRSMQDLLVPLRNDIITPATFLKYKLINEKQCLAFTNGAESWISTENEKKDPSSEIKYWLGRDNIELIQYPADDYLDYEEEDLELEQLQEIEAEFLGSEQTPAQDFDDSLRGEFMPITLKYRTIEPYDVSQAEVDAALRKDDVWQYPNHIRLAVYSFLRRSLLKKIEEDFHAKYVQYVHLCNSIRLAAKERDAYILQEARVVGMTTTGLAKYRSLVASVEPKVLMIEEAAESLEGPILVGCTRSIQQVILVGDHKQLHGSCAVKDLEGEPYYLSTSMFERLVNNNIPYIMLSQQRRMRPEIRQLVKPIYGDELQDHPLVYGREGVAGMGGRNVYFYTHEQFETVHDGTSRINIHEADMVVGMTNYLIQNGLSPEKITILTFYSGQRLHIYKLLRRHKNLSQFPIRVATVDSFQGEENDVIILSLVRSNNDKKIGFLSIANRVCVALSRARLGFYLFGNARLVSDNNGLWWDVVKILANAKDHIGNHIPIECVNHKNKLLIRHEAEWEETDGGCNKLCTADLDCGHKCPLKCHPYKHAEVNCVERCERTVKCGHPCRALCKERCICLICEDPREHHVEMTYAEFPLPLEDMRTDPQFSAPSRYVASGRLMQSRDICTTRPVMYENSTVAPAIQYYDPEFSETTISSQPRPVRMPESLNLIDLDDDYTAPTETLSGGALNSTQTTPSVRASSTPRAMTPVIDFPREAPPPIPIHSRPQRQASQHTGKPSQSEPRPKPDKNSEWPALGASGPAAKRSTANWAQKAGGRF